jgi:3-methyladenine DNA glycosylase/8-oxoguanine DNA glycosylase
VTVRERVWDAGRPVDLARTLAPLRRGAGDPAHQFSAASFYRACLTPDGEGTLAVRAVDRTMIAARAWGPGGQWLLDSLPVLCGAADEAPALDFATHPRLAELARRFPAVRHGATGLVMDALVPAVLEQRVTGMEARRAWRGMLRKYGTPAPGPVAGMFAPPAPAVLLRIPTWDWHRLGVDLQRQRAIRAAATVAPRLEEAVGLDPEAALARLRVVPGIGAWTAAETAQRALGHVDAVSVGDYHLADVVVHFFTGRARGTDEQMLELLEPWRGQRQRVVRLIELSGVGKPKFGPRYSPLDVRAI